MSLALHRVGNVSTPLAHGSVNRTESRIKLNEPVYLTAGDALNLSLFTDRDIAIRQDAAYVYRTHFELVKMKGIQI